MYKPNENNTIDFQFELGFNVFDKNLIQKVN